MPQTPIAHGALKASSRPLECSKGDKPEHGFPESRSAGPGEYGHKRQVVTSKRKIENSVYAIYARQN